jgi:hypothetical protein
VERKLRRMTILVGMIGSDGIVLAADQLMVRPATNVKEYDDRGRVRKIEYLQGHGVAYAGVGDQYTRRVESALSIRLDEGQFDFENIRRSLERTADDTIKDERAKNEQAYSPQEDPGIPDLPRDLLVVFHGPQVDQRQMWSLAIDPVRSTASRVEGCCIRGAIGNLARFFGEYYETNIPVATLKRLAAHIVLSAQRFESGMIGGLDVSLFDDAGFHRLDEEAKESLRARYRELNDLVRTQLFEA